MLNNIQRELTHVEKAESELTQVRHIIKGMNNFRREMSNFDACISNIKLIFYDH